VPPVTLINLSLSAGPTRAKLVIGTSSGASGSGGNAGGGVVSGTASLYVRRTMNTTPQFSAAENRRRRLKFRAEHRGTKECDLLVGGFVRARLADFSEAEIGELEKIMDMPDPLLADWLTGRAEIPQDIDFPLLQAMRKAALG